jgi:hypothetical protein
MTFGDDSKFDKARKIISYCIDMQNFREMPHNRLESYCWRRRLGATGRAPSRRRRRSTEASRPQTCWPWNPKSSCYTSLPPPWTYTCSQMKKALDFHQAVLDGEEGELGVVPEVEFFKEPQAVGVHGVGAQVVGLGNLLDGMT